MQATQPAKKAGDPFDKPEQPVWSLMAGEFGPGKHFLQLLANRILRGLRNRSEHEQSVKRAWSYGTRRSVGRLSRAVWTARESRPTEALSRSEENWRTALLHTSP